MIQIKSRFNATVLFEGEFATLKLCLQVAAKAKANLYGADLREADLYGADLHGANLYGADLHGADLRGAVILAGQPDGWFAFGWIREGFLSIRVGCREFRLDEARNYWQGKQNRREVMVAVDYIEAVAKIRGWKTAQ